MYEETSRPRSRKKGAVEKKSSLSIEFIGKLCLLVGAFISGLLTGRRHSNTGESNKSSTCRSKRFSKLSDSKEESLPCTEREIYLQRNLCPSFFSPNKSFSTLVLGGATAPLDIFPHLHHPTSPVQWAFYLTTTPSVLDEQGKKISPEIAWGAPVKNSKKKKRKKGKDTEIVPPTFAPSPR